MQELKLKGFYPFKSEMPRRTNNMPSIKTNQIKPPLRTSSAAVPNPQEF